MLRFDFPIYVLCFIFYYILCVSGLLTDLFGTYSYAFVVGGGILVVATAIFASRHFCCMKNAASQATSTPSKATATSHQATSTSPQAISTSHQSTSCSPQAKTSS